LLFVQAQGGEDAEDLFGDEPWEDTGNTGINDTSKGIEVVMGEVSLLNDGRPVLGIRVSERV